MLVADALRLGGAILALYPNMLASQLIGRVSYILDFFFIEIAHYVVSLTVLLKLLPEIGGNPNIRMLLEACDNSGPKDCALIPLNHCLHTPGGPLKVGATKSLIFFFLKTSNVHFSQKVFSRRTLFRCIWFRFDKRFALHGFNIYAVYYMGSFNIRLTA